MPSISILCASSFASRASAKLSNVKKPNAVRWPDRLFATMLHFWIGLINFEFSQLLVRLMNWNFQGLLLQALFDYPENFKKIHQRKLEIKKVYLNLSITLKNASQFVLICSIVQIENGQRVWLLTTMTPIRAWSLATFWSLKTEFFKNWKFVTLFNFENTVAWAWVISTSFGTACHSRTDKYVKCM